MFCSCRKPPLSTSEIDSMHFLPPCCGISEKLHSYWQALLGEKKGLLLELSLSSFFFVPYSIGGFIHAPVQVGVDYIHAGSKIVLALRICCYTPIMQFSESTKGITKSCMGRLEEGYLSCSQFLQWLQLVLIRNLQCGDIHIAEFDMFYLFVIVPIVLTSDIRVSNVFTILLVYSWLHFTCRSDVLGVFCGKC